MIVDFNFYVIPFALVNLINQLDKFNENVPPSLLSQAVSGRVKSNHQDKSRKQKSTESF